MTAAIVLRNTVYLKRAASAFGISRNIVWIFVVSTFECSYLGLFKLSEIAQSVLALTKFVSLLFFGQILSLSW
jgi:hypothetical protein